MVTKIIGGVKTEEGYPLFDIYVLRHAAENLQDGGMVEDILGGYSDGHSHACSMAVLCSHELADEVDKAGHSETAMALRTFGNAWMAFSLPGLTEDSRSGFLREAYQLVCTLLPFDDPAAVRKRHTRGIPVGGQSGCAGGQSVCPWAWAWPWAWPCVT